jgi:hypothetical protein
MPLIPSDTLPAVWHYFLSRVYMPSSVVAHMSYDPGTTTLRIRFVSGVVYDYKKVPPEIYEALKSSDSKGGYLNRYIKKHFKFKKVSREE